MIDDDASLILLANPPAFLTVRRARAHGLIQGYLGPDHKVINMRDFYSALVQALKAARENRGTFMLLKGEIIEFWGLAA